MEGLAKNIRSCECDIWRKEEEDMTECEREDTGWKKETVSDILLIATSLLQWTRWDEMPLRWKSALHRYADVKNMPLWLFGRNSQMSTYVSLTQESCCCKKKPFSHPGTLQRYQIKRCHIYTCLEEAGFFFIFEWLAEDRSSLRCFGKKGRYRWSSDRSQFLGNLSLHLSASCWNIGLCQKFWALFLPLSSFPALHHLASKWCRAQETHNQLPLNVCWPALFLTCTANIVLSYYLWGLAFGDGTETRISIKLISVPHPGPPTWLSTWISSSHVETAFMLRFNQRYSWSVGSVAD